MARSPVRPGPEWLCGPLLLLLALGGCTPARLAVKPLRYEVDVRLDPSTGSLEGRTAVELERLSDAGDAGTVELKLHPSLLVEAIEVDGATLSRHRTRRGRTGDEAELLPSVHRLVIRQPDERVRLTLSYRGRLREDVAAGEKPDEIHNFAVRAHVGEEGLFLSEGGYWYPRVGLDEDGDPAHSLANYTLVADPVEGFELVAGLERETAADPGRLRWSSPFPLDGLVVTGGPLKRWSRQHGDIALHALLDPAKQDVAQDILAAAAEYLDRYQPLIGPYPFREFTVLEAFFSSGFAFPASTQIVGSQLSAYKQYRRHGYLDHELLHNWWGNGILVDPNDGNWCEGLAAYMGNYYGYVLDQDEQGARTQRRNYSNFLSRLSAEQDKPLGTFGLEDGVGRGVGYQKGAAVFHMLQRKLGAEAFFAALRRLTDERLGRPTGWDDLQQAFERESGVDLDRFFEQWVRQGGAPQLTLLDAQWTPGSERLAVRISQEPSSFSVDVPLRLYYGERAVDTVVSVDQPVSELTVEVEPSGLTAVELDPDYHVFRKLKPAEAMPTSALTQRATRLLVVVPDPELAEGYQVVIDSYKRSVLGEDDKPKQGHAVTIKRAAELQADELAGADVLVLGQAVHHPLVRRFLERTRCPVRWNEAGASFTLQGETFSDRGHAVFLTVHHPDLEERGVTVYHGNSDAALANARVLSFYPNSLLVFQTPVDDSDAGQGVDELTAMPRTQVVRRMDFEFHDRIEF